MTRSDDARPGPDTDPHRPPDGDADRDADGHPDRAAGPDGHDPAAGRADHGDSPAPGYAHGHDDGHGRNVPTWTPDARGPAPHAQGPDVHGTAPHAGGPKPRGSGADGPDAHGHGPDEEHEEEYDGEYEDDEDDEDDGLVRFASATPLRPGPAAPAARPPAHPGPPPPRPDPAPLTRCPRCRAPLPRAVLTCPACLSPVTTAPEPGAGAALRLVFRGAGHHLDVVPGGELRLGRDAEWAPEAAALLAGETSVSGRHASVAHAEDGSATVTEVPQGATNGVRVNDRVLVPGRPEPLHDGDTVWLGPWVSLTARAPGGPGPGGGRTVRPPRSRPQAGCP
ncbi:FHA domain-containing protein [Streptomyces sp. NPDC052077]|uniref:FHA domain-containing protein n=1 Tax=Streptomyces sp. NPDC052077 TaxID=3154757 RepID=UPI003434564E